jgi:uncharacterized membrane protein YsdA (DUF1294 family)
MTTYEILSLVFGSFGVILNALIFQQKTRNGILGFKLASDFMWALQYLFKGAFSGLAVACIGIIRETVFLNHKKRWAQSKLWLVLFIVLSLVSPIITWKGFSSLLPMTASIISVIGFWLSRPLLTKVLAYPICACQLSYGIIFEIPMSIINEIITLISTTIGLIRYKKTAIK